LDQKVKLVKPTAHILIVDDAPDNRTLVQHYVTRLGYTAQTAESGREAVTRALSEDFDIILMDVQMPEMDGFEAVRELRAQAYRKPIIALTAHTMKGDRERCLESGFDDFLGKPLDRDLLCASLKRYSSDSSGH
jgi:CheY-like chemotaxis protein